MAETLLALAITVVLAAIVCAGIPVAWRTYTDTVDASNAQVLLSTATTTLRSELNRATRVDESASSGAKIAFDTGDGYRVELDGSVSGIGKATCRYTVNDSGNRVVGGEVDSSLLLTKAIRTEPLSVTFKAVSFDKRTGVFSVEGLEVKRGDDVLATVGADGTFKVKAISPEVRNDD